MPRILVVANALDGTLARAALELLGGATALAGDGAMEVDAVLLGPRMLDDAAATLGRHGAARVFRTVHPALTTGQTDAALIAVEAVMARAEPDLGVGAAGGGGGAPGRHGRGGGGGGGRGLQAAAGSRRPPRGCRGFLAAPGRRGVGAHQLADRPDPKDHTAPPPRPG